MAMDEAAVDEFAKVVRRFLHPAGEDPSLADGVAEHLGVEPSAE